MKKPFQNITVNSPCLKIHHQYITTYKNKPQDCARKDTSKYQIPVYQWNDRLNMSSLHTGTMNAKDANNERHL